MRDNVADGLQRLLLILAELGHLIRNEWQRRTWYGKLWFPFWLIERAYFYTSLLLFAAFVWLLLAPAKALQDAPHSRSRLCRRCTKTNDRA